MREFFALAAIVVIAPLAAAKVRTAVYRCDETTPLALVDPNRPGVYRDIMVGTRLVIVVSSDTGGQWQGQLWLSWDDAEFATLSARGPTIIPGTFVPNYKGSCLEAAGEQPGVWAFEDTAGTGFDFMATYDPGIPGFRAAVPGEWFIFDYRAERVGSCDVGLYGLFVSPDTPIEMLSFTHVPSRDFDGDTIVNFEDFALFAGRWRATIDEDPNSPAAVFDLNSDSRVDTDDLALFSEYCLERIDCSGSCADCEERSL